jgi:hypothetical protein
LRTCFTNIIVWCMKLIKKNTFASKGHCFSECWHYIIIYQF